MVFLVPFDGSTLAGTALVRASEYGALLEEDVTVVSVVPNDPEYAREKGWIQHGEQFEYDAVVDALRSSVKTLAPEATFRHVRVPRYAQTGKIVLAIRRIAAELDASVVFVGSENAGRFVTSISSVGGGVATDPSYDVHIVRQHNPPKIPSLPVDAEHYRTE